jgi:hypothetical protein
VYEVLDEVVFRSVGVVVSPELIRMEIWSWMQQPPLIRGDLAEATLKEVQHPSLWALDVQIQGQAGEEVRAFSEHSKPSCVVSNRNRQTSWNHESPLESRLCVSTDSLLVRPLQTPTVVSRAS